MDEQTRGEALKVRIAGTPTCQKFGIPVAVVEGIIPASERYFKWASQFANAEKAFEWTVAFGQREAMKAQQTR